MEWKWAFAPYRGVSRGISSTGLVVTLCVVKDIFSWGHILHIVAVMRGISLKRFVVNLLY